MFLPFFLKRAVWFLALGLLAACALWWLRPCRPVPPSPAPPPAAGVISNAAAAPIPVALARLGYPTRQTNLLADSLSGVFQPTAAGRPESGLFGSVRMVQRGGRLRTSFHEGIDIAALERDARGAPRDTVHAVADGTVAYLNRVSGNSNYGQYVVLRHADPLGPVYSLYAHLAEIARGLAPGQPVAGGAVLGRMGNTSSDGIPMVRAHLHLEFVLLINAGFPRWFHAQKLKPDHGLYHGWNMLGVNPLEVFRQCQTDTNFTLATLVGNLPPAFHLVVKTAVKPDYFTRYPTLWSGGEPPAGALWLAVAENGLPLAGRNATEEEYRRLGANNNAVLDVDEAVLGRNGCHLVAPCNGRWQLGENGERWLQMLLYR